MYLPSVSDTSGQDIYGRTQAAVGAGARDEQCESLVVNGRKDGIPHFSHFRVQKPQDIEVL